MRGPYVPRSRPLKRACVTGEPTKLISACSLAFGMTRSMASQRHAARSSLSFWYSSLLGSTPSHTDQGSLPAVYAWITCFPSGARAGSRADAMLTTMTLPGWSMPPSQRLTMVHCGGASSGTCLASMPMCTCMKLLHCSSLSRPFQSCSVSASKPAWAPLGTSLDVVQTSALLTTALRARTTPFPDFPVRTPTARPSSTMTSFTGVARRTRPPCLVMPRMSASMMPPEPPLGKSSVPGPA
mmetsp:Transcript_13322/g.39642  ORF Transcript_13322/g.39642 Transcript_13322/m.39642 type:complete len:240 (-) Transcript_13322:901-1620(-)